MVSTSSLPFSLRITASRADESRMQVIWERISCLGLFLADDLGVNFLLDFRGCWRSFFGFL